MMTVVPVQPTVPIVPEMAMMTVMAMMVTVVAVVVVMSVVSDSRSGSPRQKCENSKKHNNAAHFPISFRANVVFLVRTDLLATNVQSERRRGMLPHIACEDPLTSWQEGSYCSR
jgi:hypothetical protein